MRGRRSPERRGRGAGLSHAPSGTPSQVRGLQERGAKASQASPICFLDRMLCRVNSSERSHHSGSESQLLATATSVYKQCVLHPPGPAPRSPQRVRGTPPDVERSRPTQEGVPCQRAWVSVVRSGGASVHACGFRSGVLLCLGLCVAAQVHYPRAIWYSGQGIGLWAGPKTSGPGTSVSGWGQRSPMNSGCAGKACVRSGPWRAQPQKVAAPWECRWNASDCPQPPEPWCSVAGLWFQAVTVMRCTMW